MFTPTVRSLVEFNPKLAKFHKKNACSSCAHACWTRTLDGTYENSGSVMDELRFLLQGARDAGDAKGYYRCYCRISSEYMNFM